MRRVLMVGGLSLLLLVEVLAVARQQPATFPGWIYFGRYRELYRVNWTGTVEQPLPLNEISFRGLSPDKKWLLWYAPGTTDLYTDLYLGSFNLSERRLLIKDVTYAVWSPDSHQIGAIRDDNLILIEIDTDQITIVNSTPHEKSELQWSPDGQWLLFTGELDGKIWMFRIHPDSTGFQQYDVPVEPKYPRWSPDSKWIAFSGENRFDNQEIYKIRADGTDLQQLTTSVEDELFTAWNPTGEWLLHSFGLDAIQLLSVDGSKVRPMPEMQILYPHQWQGDWLIYGKNMGLGIFNLFRYNIVTGETVRLTNSPLPDIRPHPGPPADLNWHPATLTLGAALIFGTAATTMLRRKRLA